MNSCKMIIAGFGGQGILFTGKIFAEAAMLDSRNLSWLPSYGPEMRGGTANCHLIISDERVGSPIIINPDILIAMNNPSLDKFESKVNKDGYVFCDSSMVDKAVERDDVKTYCIEATRLAQENGFGNLANMIMLGAVIKVTGLFTPEQIENAIKEVLPPKRAHLLDVNMKAVNIGWESVAAEVK